ncbi:MAG: SRPBCC domain-containing protein [Maritimibacter sp.]|nr:SRPBCC domain-containing protein [Maritimibacter sp.]
MPLCEVDARPGGRFRYEFEHDSQPGFAIVGDFLSLDPGARIVHVERMLMPDPTPDNRIDTRFDPAGDGTLMTMRMRLPDAAARKAMRATGSRTVWPCGCDLLDCLAPRRRRLAVPDTRRPGRGRQKSGRPEPGLAAPARGRTPVQVGSPGRFRPGVCRLPPRRPARD